MEKMIIIEYDYRSNNNLLSYIEVKKEMEKGNPIIHTNCLDFFHFSMFDKGYDVKVVKRNGGYILLSELLLNTGEYTIRPIKKIHNVHKMLIANFFAFKNHNNKYH